MKYLIDTKKLQPGDIILAGYNDDTSKQIQERTNSVYSHAMLFGDGYIIHASNIVITGNPCRDLYEEGENVCILRLKGENRNPMRINFLLSYAKSFVGTLYDTEALDAMKEGLEVIPNRNRQMCARFVAQCFEHVCIDLVEDYETCSPQDLINLDEVDIISDVLVQADPQEVAFAESPDVTKDQFLAILSIINRLRKKYPDADIMSLQQLELFIEENPTESLDILSIMNKTDYFDLWRLERQKCSYLYDINAYKECPYFKDKILQAKQIIDDSLAIIEERKQMKDYYEKQIKNVGQLEYYKRMLLLQDNIISSANDRIKMARSYLDEQHIVRIAFPKPN